MNAYQRVLEKRISHKYKGVCFFQLSRDFHMIYASKALAEYGFNVEKINNTSPLFTNFIIPREVDYFVTETLTHLDLPRKKMAVEIQICPETPSEPRAVFCLIYRTVNTTSSEIIYDCYLMERRGYEFMESYSDACEMEIDLLYKYSLDKLDMPISMTQDLYFNYVNNKMAEIMGYSLDRMHNMRISGIVQESMYQQVAEREVKHYHGEYTNKDSVSLVTSVGNNLDMDVIGCPMMIDSVPTSMNVLVDITQRNIDIETLSVLYGVLGEISEGIFIFDSTPKITWVNEAFCHMTGYSPSEAIGLFDLITDEKGEVVDFEHKIWNDVSVAGAWDDIKMHKRKDGTLFHAHIYITALRDENNTIIKYIAIITDISREILREKRMQEQHNKDHLTGVYNRSYFMKSLAANIHESRINETDMHLIIYRINRFDNINSTFGYEVGDDVIKSLTVRVRGFVNDDSRLFRINDVTFGIIYNLEPESYVKKLISLFDWPIISAGVEININVSCGIASFPTHADNTDDLLACALDAIETETPNWKSSYYVYSPEKSHGKADTVYAMETDMRTGLEKNEFMLYFQPKVEVATRKVISCEALVRWNSARLGFMNPGDFIPLAENTGLIVPLGDTVIDLAFSQMREWLDKGYKSANMAINISLNQLMEPDFLDKLKEKLAKYNVKPSCFEFEITESIAMKDDEGLKNVFAEMEKLGIRNSIDDFGTGYSSFAQLTKFPLSEIKIDRSFITDIQTNVKNQAVVSAVISMSKRLNLTTVAEGVETEEEFAFLKECGCDVIQGFLFSRPVSAKDYEQYLEKE